VVAVQRWWHTVKRSNATICQETIKNCHSKLLTTGSVTDARKSGRPSTSRSEENVALVRDMFIHSPRKSTRQAARESGLAKEEVYRAKPRTMEQLEDRIRNVITNVQHDFLQKTVDSIPSRLRKLVDAAGTYIEF